MDATPPFNAGTTKVEAVGSDAAPGYEILGVLGQGGMGIVYKARQIELNRVVALKMIRTGSEATPEEVLRFRIERRAVARLLIAPTATTIPDSSCRLRCRNW